MDRAAASGTALLGEGGLLTEVTRAVLERALDAEMSEHLGYEKHAHAEAGAQARQAAGRVIRYSVDVDCGGLTFCDCTGLSALVAVAGAAKVHGSQLRLRSVPHPLARLVRLTHAGRVFTIE